MTGLVLERTLATTESMDQMAIHNAVFGLSGKLNTLDGSFAVNEMGAQVGEITPLGQLQADGKGGLNLIVVYPPELVNGKFIIGK
jgi:branched-chain amino acid transport system substrate-binding protein